jgi:nucleotide-binding universal stress UspA family protein
MGRKILVPVELTNYSTSVLKSAQSIKGEEDELVLLHVVLDPSEFAGFPVPHISTEKSRGELMEDAKNRMEKFIYRNARGTRYMLEFGFPYKVIPEVARREKADLIVIGSKQGAGKIEHLFVRSTSRKVLRDAPCEVKVVPLPLVSEDELEGSEAT